MAKTRRCQIEAEEISIISKPLSETTDSDSCSNPGKDFVTRRCQEDQYRYSLRFHCILIEMLRRSRSTITAGTGGGMNLGKEKTLMEGSQLNFFSFKSIHLVEMTATQLTASSILLWNFASFEGL